MNNIMKKGLLLLTTAFIAQFASAGLLYWSVDSSDLTGTDYADYAYAAIYSVNSDTTTGGTLLSNYIYGDTSGNNGTYTAISSDVVNTVAASTSNTSGYYFYVELLNESLQTIATSSAVSYDTISAYYTTSTTLSTTYTNGSYDGWSFTAAVPEPTGGLLILMGAAVLGLRRKRMA